MKIKTPPDTIIHCRIPWFGGNTSQKHASSFLRTAPPLSVTASSRSNYNIQTISTAFSGKRSLIEDIIGFQIDAVMNSDLELLNSLDEYSFTSMHDFEQKIATDLSSVQNNDKLDKEIAYDFANIQKTVAGQDFLEMDIDRRLWVCTELAKLTRKYFPYKSPNKGYLPPIPSKKMALYSNMLKKILALNILRKENLILKNLWKLENESLTEQEIAERMPQRLQQLTDVIRKYGVGQCEEMAIVHATLFTNLFGSSRNMDILRLKGSEYIGGHIFCAYGELPSKDETECYVDEIKDWDAIICDPWISKKGAFLANKYPTEWNKQLEKWDQRQLKFFDENGSKSPLVLRDAVESYSTTSKLPSLGLARE